MKALTFPGDSRVVVRELPTPNLRDDEVLIEIRAAGLCGSDLHLFYRPSATQREAGIFGLRFPVDNVAGHEPCGDVVTVGRNVSHIKVGDRVAVAHISGCGWCSTCRRGWDMHCEQKQTYGGDRQGAFAEYMPARAKDCVILPPNISYTDGAFYTCGAATGYYALRRAGLVGGETVVVVGLGPVGLAATFFAHLFGAHVIGIDRIAARCDFAKKHGAEETIDASTEDVSARVRALTAGVGADVTLDFTGAPTGRLTAFQAAKTWGRSVLVGFGEHPTTVDAEMLLIEKQLTVIGAWVFSFPELQELVAYASRFDINLEGMVASRYRLDAGPQAFHDFDAGSVGKSFITP